MLDAGNYSNDTHHLMEGITFDAKLAWKYANELYHSHILYPRF